MALEYRIYRNDGLGGPIDYSTPHDTTSALTWAESPGDGDWRYGVRTYDTATTLADDNTDARVRVVIDSGVDVSAIPASPTGLIALATEAGGCLVRWAYPFVSPSPVPTGFKVWITAGLTVNYAATPDETVDYVPGIRDYSATLAGLSDATTYAVGVRAYTATADDPNTDLYIVVGDSTPPDNVEELSADIVSTD